MIDEDKKKQEYDTIEKEVSSVDSNESSAPDTLKSNMDEELKVEKEVEVPQKKSNKKIFLFGGIILLAVFTIGWFLFSPKGNISKKDAGGPVASATAKPIPTPNPWVRSEWSLEVLNGSAVAGEAKKVAERLRELGYQVIKTGNADRDDYELSQIFISSDFKDKVDFLVADIKDVIKIASVAGELKDSSASARIIIGKD